MDPVRTVTRMSPRRRVAVTFGPTVVVLVFGLLAAWGTARERHSREAVVLSDSILTTAAELMVRVTDGETGQRGYLLTGDPAYLAPYVRARSDAAALAGQLRALTRDRAQARRADSLQALVGARFEELAETVALRDRQGAPAALAVVRTGQGRRRMEQLRGVYRDLVARERQLLLGRARREETLSGALLLIVGVGTAAAAVLSLGLNSVVARYAGALGRANAELAGANDLLQEQRTELELQNEQLQEQSAELERRSEAAEAASVAKSRFLASMSHDLRTPLNAILGYVDLLETGVRGPVTPSQTADLNRIRSSGRHLLALINDILGYARMEAGRVEIRLEALPLEALLHEAEASFLPQLQARGLHYGYAGPGEPLRVLADPDRMEQVVLNLVTNAIKFTEPGGRVSLQCAADGASVLVRVSDTGRGIPADKLPTIFEPFVQVERERTEGAHQGVGLGLAISRELARAMGGDLLVESTVDQGSVFTLRLRRAPGTGDAAPTSPPAETASLGSACRVRGGRFPPEMQDGAPNREAPSSFPVDRSSSRGSEEEVRYVPAKLPRMRSPLSWLFSGWNWIPHTLSRRTMEANATS